MGSSRQSQTPRGIQDGTRKSAPALVGRIPELIMIRVRCAFTAVISSSASNRSKKAASLTSNSEKGMRVLADCSHQYRILFSTFFLSLPFTIMWVHAHYSNDAQAELAALGPSFYVDVLAGVEYCLYGDWKLKH
jgi:hypothetical protein